MRRCTPPLVGSVSGALTPELRVVVVPKVLLSGIDTAYAPPSRSTAFTCTPTEAPASQID
jgi:hypothetical protein